MKLLVCLSHVPDTTTKIQIDPSGSDIVRNGVTFVYDPNAEYGLSRAVELREAKQAEHLVVLCVGGPDVEPTIRKALAVGADAGVRIDVQTRDAFVIAHNIAEYARGQAFDLILFGKESIATNDSSIPAMVAELLDLPLLNYASHLEISGNQLTVTCDIEGGEEHLECPTPAVLTAQKGIAEWRIANMRGIMAARTKKIDVLPSSGATPRVATAKLELPPPKGGVTMIDADNLDQLVQVLVDKGVL